MEKSLNNRFLRFIPTFVGTPVEMTVGSEILTVLVIRILFGIFL